MILKKFLKFSIQNLSVTKAVCCMRLFLLSTIYGENVENRLIFHSNTAKSL